MLNLYQEPMVWNRAITSVNKIKFEKKFWIMSIAEMKKNIIEKVEKLTDAQLAEVNRFVDSMNTVPAKEYDLMPHVENIVSEREEVLKKLAK